MSEYIVSARKYRPTTFESVVGQKALTETLRNAIRQDRLAHAYLFCGPRGVGKTTCARIFAKTINCLQPTADHDACNECESCVAFNEQRSMNIHELDAASNNSVEDIRALIQEVRIPPQIGKYSVYIIDEVHMLSQGAFNALLKTLEEPPSYAIFILATTEKHKVLPTILSRCQVFDFQRITLMDIVHHLQYVAQTEGIEAEQEALRVVAEKADGGMRDALSIFDQLAAFCNNHITYQQTIDVLNVLDANYYFRMVDSALRGQVHEVLMFLNDILQKGFDAGHFIIGLMQHLRNLLVAQDKQTLPLLETSEQLQQRYLQQAQQCEAPWLFQSLDILNSLDINYRTAKNKRLTVEVALVKWVGCKAVPTAPQVAPATAVKPTPASKPAPTTSTAPAAPVTPKPAPATAANMMKLPSLKLPTETPPATPSSAPNEVQKDTQQRPFTVDQLRSAWVGLKNNFPQEERLKSMLTEYIPEIDPKDPNALILTLINSWQKADFVQFNQQILNSLRHELGNDLITLNIQVEEYHHEQQAFTAGEKYKLLVQRNPNLQTLREHLSLQLE
ncbi:MAG: DNA polymerase III subunit gamma/tau [Paludibacteraceae bacterium]|nr:DNA polymerase III subunit gamma/tau [Paludibacteraceae bacterium]